MNLPTTLSQPMLLALAVAVVIGLLAAALSSERVRDDLRSSGATWIVIPFLLGVCGLVAWLIYGLMSGMRLFG